MKVEEIEIHSGRPEFEFTPVRQLEVKCEATNALMPAPTIEEANGRLRAMAVKVGANAIIDVTYNSGVSFTSWKSLKATGLAVHRLSDERSCPFCAETIKRAALVCKHCGRDLSEHRPQAVLDAVGDEPDRADGSPAPVFDAEPLRENNNPAIIIGLIGFALFVIFLFLSTAH